MNISIIPARGGSKRIPRKNIKEFCGKPMIAYAITVANQSGLFEHIVVSTDDEEIAQTARAWGDETPFVRPSELANDLTKENIRAIRPGLGLATKYFDVVMGKKLKQDVNRRTALTWELLK